MMPRPTSFNRSPYYRTTVFLELEQPPAGLKSNEAINVQVLARPTRPVMPLMKCSPTPAAEPASFALLE